MKQSGFEDALAKGPWPTSALRTVDGGANSPEPGMAASAPVDEGQIEEPQVPHRLRKILPYRWIPRPADGGSALSAHVTSLESALSGLGLSSEDAASLARGVLSELIENVQAHAPGSPERALAALTGAAVVGPDGYASRIDDFSPHLRDFARWASRTRSPLIRLFVADSGRGLVPSLAEAKHSSGRSSGRSAPRAGRDAQDLTDGQDTILYAFERWSTSSATDRGLSRGARGLWKVSRIVRSYQGSVLVSTGTDTAGLIFDGSPDGSTVRGVTPAWVPGTAVECDILTRPNVDAAQADEEAPSSRPSLPADGPNLVPVTVALRPGQGFAADDVGVIENALGTVRESGPSGLVIAVETPSGGESLDDAQIQDSLKQVLNLASAAANPATVALVFPNINRRLLSVAVESLNDEHDPDLGGGADGFEDPILVIGPERMQHWAGGKPRLRRLLEKLSDEQGPLRLDDLAEPDEQREIRKEIRGQAGLLSLRSGGRVHLRLRRQDVLDTLTRDLRARIENLIQEGDAPGVQSGTFLTPTLHVASRWCNADDILRHLGAERLAGFTLAAALEARLGRLRPGPRPPSVLMTGSLTPEFVTTFGRSLAGVDTYFDSADSLGLDRASSTRSEIRQVVLLIDLISTGRTLARVVSELVARNLRPVAIATVVDGRAAPQAGTAEMTFEECSLPLVSLARVAIDASDQDLRNSRLTPIDPVLGRPIASVRPSPKSHVLQKDYTDALARTSAARLGHIHRPASRHYTAYVDPTLLFHDPAWNQRVMRLIRGKVGEGRREVFAADDPDTAVCILFPYQTTDDISGVARLAGDALAADGIAVVGVLPVPRAPLGTKWLFPGSIPLHDKARHIVVIDSGTGTGHSVQQMIRIAAARGIRLITVILLLNGLSDLDALALAQIRVVRASGPQGGPGESAEFPSHGAPGGAGDPDDIPVRLHFVVRTAVTSLDARDCSVCALRRSYESLPAHVPTRIEEQCDWLLGSLEMRSKGRVFEEEATDLLGTHLSQEDCIAYLTWKAVLREAQLNTLARRKVVEDIAAMAHDQTRRDALVRLLTAEGNWLRSAPLRFPDVRVMVAKLAASLILGDSAWPIDPALRVQAVILLAAAHPDYFVDKFRSIVASSQDHKLVIGQVLLETLVLVRIADGQPRPWSERLVANLAGLEDELRESPRTAAAWAGSVPLEEVRYLISVGRRALQSPSRDPQRAWDDLRRYRLSVKEHQFDAAMWRLQVTLDNRTRGFILRDPQSARQDWRKCADFLATEVLPNLESVGRLLLAPQVTNRLGHEDADRWAEVMNGRGGSRLDEITVRLNSVLSASPTDDPSMAGDSTESLIVELQWWSRFFLAAHADPGRSREGAFLTEVVRECPTRLFDVLHGVFEGTDYDLHSEGVTDDESLQVFCTDTLMRDVFSHIRMNAELTHRVRKHRGSADDRQRFLITVREADAGHLVVAVRNTHSAVSGQGGQKGLGVMASGLSGFGATIAVLDGVERPWTFGVAVSLERWRA
jgi:orotate phosphoribosyltransferase-like protein